MIIVFFFQHLENNKDLSNGSRLIVSTSKFNDFNIIIKDSYSLRPSKLSLFPEMFGLEQMQKDIMPFKLYTIENVEKGMFQLKKY